MGSFDFDKKKEHEALAEKALKKHDYATAYHHTKEAARFTFMLADKCVGALRNAYERNASDLVDIAYELRERARNKTLDTDGKSNGQKAEGTASDGKWQIGERPEERLADVAGMEDVKEQIRLRIIEPLKRPEEARKHGLSTGGGILLYGPPGTGKTFLARAVAGELNLPFYAITAADIFGKYVGESEANVRAIFEAAEKNPLSVIFIDELETICRRRTDDVHETTQKVITMLLQELDGVGGRKNPFLLLGATNMPWMVDEAFLRPGRFDVHAYVGLPVAEARKQIILNAFRKVSYPVDDDAIQLLVKRTDGFSGADISGVVQRLRQMAFDAKAERYTAALCEKALEGASPSCNADIMASIEEWEAKNGIQRKK